MGYPNLQKGYRVLEISTREFLVSRDVIFHEHIFPFSESASQNEGPKTISSHHNFLSDEASYQDLSYIPVAQTRSLDLPPALVPPNSDSNLTSSEHIQEDTLEDSIANVEIHDTAPTSSPETSQSTTGVEYPRRSGRATRPLT